MENLPNQSSPDTPDESVSPPTPVVYESEDYHWEYKQIKLNLDEESSLDEARLNELGTEGWELAGVFTHHKTAHYYFKKPTG